MCVWRAAYSGLSAQLTLLSPRPGCPVTPGCCSEFLAACLRKNSIILAHRPAPGMVLQRSQRGSIVRLGGRHWAFLPTSQELYLCPVLSEFLSGSCEGKGGLPTVPTSPPRSPPCSRLRSTPERTPPLGLAGLALPTLLPSGSPNECGRDYH